MDLQHITLAASGLVLLGLIAWLLVWRSARRVDARRRLDARRPLFGSQTAPSTRTSEQDEQADKEPPTQNAGSGVSTALESEAHKVLRAATPSLWDALLKVLGQRTQIDASLLDAIEETLIVADVGIAMTSRLIETLRRHLLNEPEMEPGRMREVLRQILRQTLSQAQAPIDLDAWARNGDTPRVLLFVGVNGVGKTTTVGKIAHLLTSKGHTVVLAAGDTFRAAATEQLQIWGERTGAQVVGAQSKADPASVMFNAIDLANKARANVLLADTAGRLHTQDDLMAELKKIKRALQKARPGAPDATWLVVDATTGQNALHQAKAFHEALTLSGIVLTKYDGTAKGGIVLAIVDALGVPIQAVGVGEQADALQAFDAESFIEALL